MSRAIFLDAGPLGMVTHPRANPAIAAWLKERLAHRDVVLVPEIADYEVRRELLHAKKKKSVGRLDDLKTIIGYVPLTTSAMLMAAELWAQARRAGKPTADPKSLDGDVILAAQALTFDAASNVVIATDNVGHLSRFTTARRWDSIR